MDRGEAGMSFGSLSLVEGMPATFDAVALEDTLCLVLDEATFQEYAAEAKAKCPVSKALAGGPEIVLNARLVG